MCHNGENEWKSQRVLYQKSQKLLAVLNTGLTANSMHSNTNHSISVVGYVIALQIFNKVLRVISSHFSPF